VWDCKPVTMCCTNSDFPFYTMTLCSTKHKFSCIIPGLEERLLHSGCEVRGLDIGCGANLVYPLLGAAMLGWHFVGVDVTPVALEWARLNREANPALSGLIEVRGAPMQPEQEAIFGGGGLRAEEQGSGGRGEGGGGGGGGGGARRQQQQQQESEKHLTAANMQPASPLQPVPQQQQQQLPSPAPGILAAAIGEGECFAFCMCNPPFFESISEAGRNPATAYGGTAEEMVYPGGWTDGWTGGWGSCWRIGSDHALQEHMQATPHCLSSTVHGNIPFPCQIHQQKWFHVSFACAASQPPAP
jgi:hypothetical protein